MESLIPDFFSSFLRYCNFFVFGEETGQEAMTKLNFEGFIKLLIFDISI